MFLALHRPPCESEEEVSHPLESLDLVHVISLDFFNVTIDNEYILDKSVSKYIVHVNQSRNNKQFV